MSLIFYIATIGTPYYWPPYPTSPVQTAAGPLSSSSNLAASNILNPAGPVCICTGRA